MKKIFAHIGVIGSGKDYRSQKGVEENRNAIKIGFSDGIRELTFSSFNWMPKDEQEYREFKNTQIKSKFFELKGREVLKNLGMRLRQHNPSFWADWTAKKIVENFTKKATEVVFVSDVRFKEEIEALFKISKHYSVNLDFVFCDYKSEFYEVTDHESEKLAVQLLKMGCKDGEVINSKLLNLIK